MGEMWATGRATGQAAQAAAPVEGRAASWTARWSARRRCLRGSRGASTLEYLGVLGVVVAVVGSLLAMNLSPQVVAGTRDAVCEVLSLECGSQEAAGGPGPGGETLSGDGRGGDGSAEAADTGLPDADGAGLCQGWGGCAWFGVSQVGSAFWNAGRAAVDEVVGLVTLVTQPWRIVDVVEYIVTHPLDTLRQLVWDDPAAELWQQGDYGGAIGRTIWNVASVFIPFSVDVPGLGRTLRGPDPSDVVDDVARRTADDAAGAAGDAARIGAQISTRTGWDLLDEVPRGFRPDGTLPRNTDRLVLNQGRTYGCGPYSCAMVLDTMGRPVDVGELMARMDGPGGQGTTLRRLSQMMNDAGVDAVPDRRMSMLGLRNATTENPAIVVIETKRRNSAGQVDQPLHAVVVDGVTTRNGQEVVAIRNPWGESYFQTLESFEEQFTGQGLRLRQRP